MGCGQIAGKTGTTCRLIFKNWFLCYASECLEKNFQRVREGLNKLLVWRHSGFDTTEDAYGLGQLRAPLYRAPSLGSENEHY